MPPEKGGGHLGPTVFSNSEKPDMCSLLTTWLQILVDTVAVQFPFLTKVSLLCLKKFAGWITSSKIMKEQKIGQFSSKLANFLRIKRDDCQILPK